MSEQLIQTDFFDPVLPYITGMGQEKGKWWMTMDFHDSELSLDLDTVEQYFHRATLWQGVPAAPKTFKGIFKSDELGSMIFYKFQRRTMYKVRFDFNTLRGISEKYNYPQQQFNPDDYGKMTFSPEALDEFQNQLSEKIQKEIHDSGDDQQATP